MTRDGLKHVLLIEDDADIRMVLSATLEVEGYQVSTAHHGKAGWELLLSSEKRPQLILLDWMMPVMSGHEFLKLQTEHPEFSRIPTIIISALHPSPDMTGARGFLRKPFAIEDLLLLVATQFE
jgi:two-component system phosphate regulon response regulator PhoB